MTMVTKTVFVTDIVASTQLFSAAGSWRAERIRATHFDLLGKEVAHRRGNVVKTVGDGVIAVFDCARDAMDCAVAVQVALREHRTAERDNLAVRIGVNSGDVTADHGDYFGLPVTEASRLCSLAAGGGVLISDSTRLLARHDAAVIDLGEVQLKGLPYLTHVWSVSWKESEGTPVRAVLADDEALMREGIALVLASAGIEVVGQATNAEELIQLTQDLQPDLAIVDVHMPPTDAMQGLQAAIRIRERHPQTNVLLLSADFEPRYAQRLLAAFPAGVGYLIKDQVSDVTEFAAAARRVAAGGTAFEADLLSGSVLTSLGARSVS